MALGVHGDSIPVLHMYAWCCLQVGLLPFVGHGGGGHSCL